MFNACDRLKHFHRLPHERPLALPLPPPLRSAAPSPNTALGEGRRWNSFLRPPRRKLLSGAREEITFYFSYALIKNTLNAKIQAQRRPRGKQLSFKVPLVELRC